MDRITESLLEEFSKETELTSLSQASQFEHLATYLTVSKYISETFDTRELVTGSGGDTGIDAVAIVVNGGLIVDEEMVEELATANGFLDVTFVFVQAERSSSFETAKIGQFGFGVLDFFKDQPALARNEMISEAAAVMSAIYERSSKFKRGKPTCRLYYVTTGTWQNDQNLEARRSGVVADLMALQIFRDVEFIPVDADSIQKMYNHSKNAIQREFVFAYRTVLPEMPGVPEAYVGILPAKEYLNLISEDGEILKNLFYDNVRDWLEYNPVNTEIGATLASPAMKARFAIMNNGVTVIAKTMRSTGYKMYIEDYQVVNGCQTSHVLFDQRDLLDETVMVPIKIIASQDDEVITSIVQATNRQTEVPKEQLMALSDFQKKLEAFFATFDGPRRLYYERRSRQYNHVSGVEKTRIVTPSNVIRAYAAMMQGEPHLTTRNFRALMERVGDTIFGADHKLEAYYLVAFALYRLEYLFRNQTIDSKFKPARYHLLMAVRVLANGRNTPRANSHEMGRFCETMLDQFWDAEKAERLFLTAVEIVEQVAAGNFHRDHIRTLPFTDAVKQKCSEHMITFASGAQAEDSPE